MRKCIAYFAAPNGLERELITAEVEGSLGDDSGLGLAETLPDLGKSSNLRRLS